MTAPADRSQEIVPGPGSAPAIVFAATEGPSVPTTIELVPSDVLVLWEDERADHYKRVVALTIGNKLKLMRITAGRGSGIEVICEVPLVDEPAFLRTQFLTRDALLFWAAPRHPKGLWKVLVLRIGSVVKMIRVAGDEAAPAIEVLHSLDLTA